MCPTHLAEQSPLMSAHDFVPYDDKLVKSRDRFSASVIVKGSSDGLSSSELKSIKLVKKDTSTPWYDAATPVRSNGRSHPIEIRYVTFTRDEESRARAALVLDVILRHAVT